MKKKRDVFSDIIDPVITTILILAMCVSIGMTLAKPEPEIMPLLKFLGLFVFCLPFGLAIGNGLYKMIKYDVKHNK